MDSCPFSAGGLWPRRPYVPCSPNIWVTASEGTVAPGDGGIVLGKLGRQELTPCWRLPWLHRPGEKSKNTPVSPSLGVGPSPLGYSYRGGVGSPSPASPPSLGGSALTSSFSHQNQQDPLLPRLGGRDLRGRAVHSMTCLGDCPKCPQSLRGAAAASPGSQLC